MSKVDAGIEKRVADKIAEIELEMANAGFKETARNFMQVFIDKMRNDKSVTHVDSLIEAVAKSIGSQRIELQLCGLVFLHSFLNLVPERSKQEFGLLGDTMEKDIAPRLYDSFTKLQNSYISDPELRGAMGRRSYVTNPVLAVLCTILLCLEACHKKFGTGRNGRLRRFENFINELTIDAEVSKEMDQLNGMNFDLLTSDKSFFTRVESDDPEDFKQRVRLMLKHIGETREDMRFFIGEKLDKDSADQFDSKAEQYRKQLGDLGDIISGKRRMLDDPLLELVGREESFSRFLLNDLPTLNEGASMDISSIVKVIERRYDEIFGNEHPVKLNPRSAEVSHESIIMPRVMNRQNSHIDSDAIDFRSPIAPESRSSNSGIPKRQAFFSSPIQGAQSEAPVAPPTGRISFLQQKDAFAAFGVSMSEQKPMPSSSFNDAQAGDKAGIGGKSFADAFSKTGGVTPGKFGDGRSPKPMSVASLPQQSNSHIIQSSDFTGEDRDDPDGGNRGNKGGFGKFSSMFTNQKPIITATSRLPHGRSIEVVNRRDSIRNHTSPQQVPNNVVTNFEDFGEVENEQDTPQKEKTPESVTKPEVTRGGTLNFNDFMPADPQDSSEKNQSRIESQNDSHMRPSIFNAAFGGGNWESGRQSGLHSSGIVGRKSELRNINVSAIDRRSSSSFIEHKSSAKFVFGSSQIQSKQLESSGLSDKRGIISNALGKVSSLISGNKIGQISIKPTKAEVSNFSGSEPQVQIPVAQLDDSAVIDSRVNQNPVPFTPVYPTSNARVEQPKISRKLPEVDPFMISPIPQQNNFGGFNDFPDSSHGGSSFPQSSVDKPKEPKSRKVVAIDAASKQDRSESAQVAGGLGQRTEDANGSGQGAKEGVFSLDDFASATSEKNPTPPESSIKNYTNILPEEVKNYNNSQIASSGRNEAPTRLGHQQVIRRQPKEEDNLPGSSFDVNGSMPLSPTKPNVGKRIGVMQSLDGGSKARPQTGSFKSAMSINALDSSFNVPAGLEQQLDEHRKDLEALQIKQAAPTAADSSTKAQLQQQAALFEKVRKDYEELLEAFKKEGVALRGQLEQARLELGLQVQATSALETETAELRTQLSKATASLSAQKRAYEEGLERQKEKIKKVADARVAAAERACDEKLKNSMNESNSEVFRLQSELDAYTLENNNLKLELDSRRGSVGVEISNVHSKIEAIRSSLTQARKDLANGLASARISLEQSRRGSSTQNVEVDRLNKQLQGERRRNDELVSKISQLTAEVQVLKSSSRGPKRTEGGGPDLGLFRLKLGKLRQGIRETELVVDSTVANLKHELHMISQKKKHEFFRKVSGLETLTVSQNNELSKLGFQVSSLRDEVSRLKDKNSQLLEQNQTLRRTFIDFKKSSGSAVAPAQAEVDGLRTRLRQMEYENKSLCEINKSVSTELIAAKEHIIHLQTENATVKFLQATVTNLNVENEELNNSNKLLFQEVAETRSGVAELPALRAQVRQLQADLSAMRMLGQQYGGRVEGPSHSLVIVNNNTNAIVTTGRDSMVHNEPLRSSTVTGTAFVRKFEMFMDILSAQNSSESAQTPIDKDVLSWLDRRPTEEAPSLARLCTQSKYTLFRTSALRLSVEEVVMTRQSGSEVQLKISLQNTQPLALNLLNMRLACQSEFVRIEPETTQNFELRALETFQFSGTVYLHDKYANDMAPVFLSFCLLDSKTYQDFSGGPRGEALVEENFHCVALPLTLNKLLPLQREDPTKFSVIKSLQMVGDIEIKRVIPLTQDKLFSLFPNITTISEKNRAYGLKVISALGSFLVTIALDLSMNINLKLFAMYRLPLHEHYLNALRFILQNI